MGLHRVAEADKNLHGRKSIVSPCVLGQAAARGPATLAAATTQVCPGAAATATSASSVVAGNITDALHNLAAPLSRPGIGRAALARRFHFGVTSSTFGKYFLNRSASRVAIFQPIISACAPMKKSGSGIFGGALPPDSRRAVTYRR
jgi:hypothetical protein